MMGPWQDRLQELLGYVARPGQKDRSNREQQALHRSGATPARGGTSAHNIPDHALDISMRTGLSASEVNRRMQQAGIEGHATFERGPRFGEGTAPHIHVDRRGQRNGRTQVASNNRQRDPLGEVVTRAIDEAEGGTTGTSQRGREIIDPGTIGPEARQRFEETDRRAQSAMTVVDQAVTDIDAIQDRRIIATKDRIAQTEAVNEEIQERTGQMLETVRPLFEQRRAIADQQMRLARMNPIERGLRSLFDARYDRSHLEALDQGIAGQLEAAGTEFSAITQLQTQMVDIIEGRAADMDSLEQLGIQESEIDIQLAGQSYAAAERVFQSIGSGLAQQGQLTAAQAQRRAQIGATMTMGEAAAYLNQANQQGGTIMVDGAEFSAQELSEIRDTRHLQDVEVQRADLTLQLTRDSANQQAIEFHQAQQNRVVGTMTEAQIRDAIANGGQFRGQQYDLRVLGEALNSAIQRNELVAGSMSGNGSVQSTQQIIRNTGHVMRQVVTNTTSLTGSVPPEVQALTQQIAIRADELAQIQRRLAAGDPSVSQAHAQRMAAEFVQMQTQLREAGERVAERWAGGRRELLPLAQAYISGQPISGPAAIDGLITLARSGQGGNLRGTARAAYEAARGAIRNIEASSGGQSIDQILAGGTPQSRTEMQTRLREAVGQAVSRAYNGQAFDSTLRNATSIGQRLGLPGGRIDAQTWRNAIVAGDREAYAQIGAQLNLTPQEAETLFERQGEQGPIWQRIRQESPNADYQELARNVSIMQQTATFRALDSTHPNIDGERPSALMVSMLSDERFQSAATRMQHAIGRRTLIGFTADAISGGTLGGDMENYAQSATLAANAQQIQSVQTALSRSREYAANPRRRMEVVLSTLFNSAESRALAAALHQQAGGDEAIDARTDERAGFSADQSNQIRRINQLQQWDQMLTALHSSRFQDPNLERLRRTAATNIEDAIRSADAVVGALSSRGE